MVRGLVDPATDGSSNIHVLWCELTTLGQKALILIFGDTGGGKVRHAGSSAFHQQLAVFLTVLDFSSVVTVTDKITSYISKLQEDGIGPHGITTKLSRVAIGIEYLKDTLQRNGSGLQIEPRNACRGTEQR